MQPPQLKRGLFGYSRNSVMALIGDRDTMFVKASDQARQAEARAAELERDLKQTLGRLNDLSAQLEEAATEARRLRAERDELAQRAERSGDEAAKISRLELDARSARAEAADLAARLRESESRVDHLEAEVEALDRELKQTRELADASIVVSVSDAPSTAEELSGALEAAEHAVSRIVEAARERGREELKELEQARGQIHQEMDRLAEWRRAFVPAVQDLKGWIEDTRQQTIELSERLRDAMGPASSVLQGLTERLTRLSELPEISPATELDQALDPVVVLNGSSVGGGDAQEEPATSGEDSPASESRS
ncbi:MAG: hypothetical protein ACE14W_05840 [Candidatus Velamenicoccus archaeovorus]